MQKERKQVYACDPIAEKYRNPFDRQIWQHGYAAGVEHERSEGIMAMISVLHSRKCKRQQIIRVLQDGYDLRLSEAQQFVMQALGHESR